MAHPENELPPPTDAAREIAALRKQVLDCEFDNTLLRKEREHSDAVAARALARADAFRFDLEDAAAQLAQVTNQWQQAEAHNTELQGVLAAVRTWAQDVQTAAITRLAQGSPDPRAWQARLDAAKAVWALVKPVV
jgi:chromosome segregation ATPase